MSYIYKDKRLKTKMRLITFALAVLNFANFANCNNCFQVHLTRADCNGTLSNSSEPYLLDNVVTVDETLDQSDAISQLKQENAELQNKFTKTYESLEETIDYLKNKMLDWSKSQGNFLFVLK